MGNYTRLLPGFAGSQGFGPQGAQGIDGNQGAQGLAYTGFDDATGTFGSQGNQGSGTQGIQGTQGTIGYTQRYGAQGNQGSQINQYFFTGPQGPQGLSSDLIGIQGWQGEQGSQTSSFSGAQGFLGTQGPQTSGAQGPQGQQGLESDDGLIGPQGSQAGPISYRGPQGDNGGADGFRGFQGIQGLQGVQTLGAQGVQGPQGIFYDAAAATFYDDFIGDTLHPAWDVTLDGSSTITFDNGANREIGVAIFDTSTQIDMTLLPSSPVDWDSVQFVEWLGGDATGSGYTIVGLVDAIPPTSGVWIEHIAAADPILHAIGASNTSGTFNISDYQSTINGVRIVKDGTAVKLYLVSSDQLQTRTLLLTLNPGDITSQLIPSITLVADTGSVGMQMDFFNIKINR